ncbi:hypothetical protein BKA67DRAFT_263439 [Truncatella angustata]|uniref:AAA+ ATPase domain-containing protein n=1 Tax=Truncatella angustata TaxID=152316 RepID=A0A9P8ZXD6_9PEZI|nr:uncharacterized protein BKA67DRAFT_263439 [Truncatella angustata]KAH6653884.1 hypothetical protein BKA67DRAFT_263439 [Truncatella angustata]
MHHVSQLRGLMANFESDADMQRKANTIIQRKHLQVLLDFIGPKYQELCSGPIKRLSQALPTIHFSDIWYLMKPGSMAYARWEDQWIGCVIESSTRIPPNLFESTQEKWEITIWFLRASWSSDIVGCATMKMTIDNFDGEKHIYHLPIIPREIHDRSDSNARRILLEERGLKVCEFLQGNSRHLGYKGECLDYARTRYNGQIILGQAYGLDISFPPNNWTFTWNPLSSISHRGLMITSEGVADVLDAEANNFDVFSYDHMFLLSPCLSAFVLSLKTWFPINVSNIHKLMHPSRDSIPTPIIDPEKHALMLALIESQLPRGGLEFADYYGEKGNGVVLLCTGGSGVGKHHYVETISMLTRRPLITLSRRESSAFRYQTDLEIMKWFFLAEKWNAILCLDNPENPAIINTIEYFGGVLYVLQTLGELTSSRPSILTSRANLVLDMYMLDVPQRAQIWRNLSVDIESRYSHIHLSQGAQAFLDSQDLHSIECNGHEIVRCFQSAVALATFRAKSSKVNPKRAAESEIIIEAEHFKDVMNMAYSSKQNKATTTTGTTRMSRSQERFQAKVKSSGDAQDSADQEEEDSQDEQTSTQLPTLSATAPSAPIVLNSDVNLCIPDLNFVEWENFQILGRGELFRTTKFYAIDVLVDEPIVLLDAQTQQQKRHRNAVRTSSNIDTLHPIKTQQRIIPASQNPLPERIRVNSPAIRKAFREIHDEEGPGHAKPFLIFRPFRSLLYYEEDFKELAAKKYKNKSVNEEPGQDGSSRIPKVHQQLGADPELEEIQCLLSFIDIIKKKQQAFDDCSCKKVTFSDIWLLFNPGDVVITKKVTQAYRVIKVVNPTHRYKDPREKKSRSWQDQTKAEIEDTPVQVNVVRIEFDGSSLGPVKSTINIKRFDGEKDIQSLPIYPLKFSTQPQHRASLIERGKLFMEVSPRKHMHFSGITLENRDEVDSQVIIDFDEAFYRYPRWRLKLMSLNEINSAEPRIPESEDESDFDSERDVSNTRLFSYRRSKVRERGHIDNEDSDGQHATPKTTSTLLRSCLKECCANELCYDDKWVDDRRREEYITSSIKNAAAKKPSVGLVSRSLIQTMGDDSLTEDDLMILPHRVFGFILRSRKWAKLDLSGISRVAVLSDAEGFDQLVLPPGHKEMVKSMIRQHFREKAISPFEQDQGDVVRGKGKGLIMLLHGVPGVGKTSTAECVADSFGKPLFQITSGDLGTTAKEVEAALEENFSLASRWDCILLIDEADVFLAERTKEDFIRNSLVAVFLRVLEYYAGVLFLTTNRVGVFDEAFTSRIHISLYYPPLKRDAAHLIFEKNMDKIKSRYAKSQRQIDIKVSEITKFALDYYDQNDQGRWNGRQIRNAFQTALALAELEALGPNEKNVTNAVVTLGRANFETVATAYKGFMDYLNQTYGGTFARRARENLWRSDTFGMPRVPNPLTTRLRSTGSEQRNPDYWPRQNYSGFNQNSNAPQQFPPQASGYTGYYSEQHRDPQLGPQLAQQYPNPPSDTAPQPHSAGYVAYPHRTPSELQPDGHRIPPYADIHNAQHTGARPGFSGHTGHETSPQTASNPSQPGYGSHSGASLPPHWPARS